MQFPTAMFFFRDSLAFCTEPVLASLANILYPPSTYGPGINDETTGTPAISEAAANELKNFTLEDIEIKMGFREVSPTFGLSGFCRVS